MKAAAAGKKRATVRDVARNAGVDPSIVSRVLNGDAGRVSPETRERIVNAAQTLGYRPNALARSLSLGKTLTIGVLAPSLTNPGYAEMLAGIEHGAAAHGYVLLHASTHDDDAAMIAQIERMEHRVDGILMASARRGSAALAALEQARVPFVLVNRAGGKENYSVVGDDAEAARIATAHLISLGHERIGYVTGPDDIDTLVRRLAGYRDAMTMARLPIDPAWVIAAKLDEAGGAEATRQLLALPEKRRPTAIFYSTISIALGGAEAARELRFRVPDDLSLVSFDDSPLLRHLAVPMTAMRMPDNAMGLKAVEVLHDRIEGRDAARHTKIAKRPELIIRSSTRAPEGAKLTPSATSPRVR
jgi:LacI family transcriptional regulator